MRLSMTENVIRQILPEDEEEKGGGCWCQGAHLVWLADWLIADGWLQVIFGWWPPSLNTPSDQVSHLCPDRSAFVRHRRIWLNSLHNAAEGGPLAKHQLWLTLLRKPTFMETSYTTLNMKRHLWQSAMLKRAFSRAYNCSDRLLKFE